MIQCLPPDARILACFLLLFCCMNRTLTAEVYSPVRVSWRMTMCMCVCSCLVRLTKQQLNYPECTLHIKFVLPDSVLDFHVDLPDRSPIKRKMTRHWEWGMGDHVLFTSKIIHDQNIWCFTGPGSGKFWVHFSGTFHRGRFCTCGNVTGLRIRFTWAYGVIDQRHGSMPVCQMRLR